MGGTDLPSEERADVQQALAKLRYKDRDLLIRAYVDGQKSPEIARSLGVTPAAARKRLARAAERLRDALGTSYNDKESASER